jgi:predicted dehydrogenase/trans-aconitate methyltransferase
MTVRLGIIGCGNAGASHARALHEGAALATHAELVAVASRSPEPAQRLADKVGCAAETVDGLLDRADIDAVIVCTPSGTHADLAELVLGSGKHLLVEKPLATTERDARRLRHAAESTGLVVSVVSQHRFDRASRFLRTELDRGSLGRLTSVSLEVPLWRGAGYYADSGWRGTTELDGGGAVINQGVHLVDLAQWLVGPVRRVHAFTSTATHGLEVEDTAAASLLFDGGVPGVLLATTAAYPGRTTRLTVHGNCGSAVVDDDELVYFHSGEPTPGDDFGAYGAGNQAHDVLEPVERGDGMPLGPLADQVRDFCDAITTGRAPLVDIAAGHAALSTVLAVYESARTGQPVEVATAGAPTRRADPPAERKRKLAETFDLCAETYERVGVEHFGPMGQRLVEHAAPPVGGQVLDVGCGTGACLVPAARAVGRTGGVVGIDTSPGMVERSREVAEAAGLPGVHVQVADAELVDLDVGIPLDGSFDTVLCGMSLFFVPSPRTAIARFAELLKPTGTLAVSWWGRTDPRWEAVLRASAPYGTEVSVHVLDEDSPFRSVDALHDALRHNGFVDVSTVSEESTTVFDDAEHWWRWLYSTAGRVFWDSIPAADLPVAKAAVEAELRRLRADGQPLTWRSEVRYTVARGLS